MHRNEPVAFITLGCRVNSSESEGMRALFEADGYSVVSDLSVASVIVINTCTVTKMSDSKSRQMIRRARKQNPSAIIAVVGCYVQVAAKEVENIGGADILLGNNEKHRIVAAVAHVRAVRRQGDTRPYAYGEDKNLLKNDENPKNASPVEGAKVGNIDEDTKNVVYGEKRKEVTVCHVPQRQEMTVFEELPLEKFAGQTRAFVRIQDGCNQFCSYCIIPYARGPVRSRDFQSVLDEVKSLVKNGYTEIVLTGIHLASYHAEKPQEGLVALVQALNKLEMVQRIRFGSIEPMLFTEDFLAALRESEKFCPHFHLSLQSGCEATLVRMNRHYTPAEYAAIVKKIRQIFPDANVTTDVMVGFPGETAEAFEVSYRFCQEMKFGWMHVFPFSPRKGTVAAKMTDLVAPEEKSQRVNEMTHLAKVMRQSAFAQEVGTVQEVLFEQKLTQKTAWRLGYTRNFLQIAVKDASIKAGEYRFVRLHNVCDAWIEGIICNGQ